MWYLFLIAEWWSPSIFVFYFSIIIISNPRDALSVGICKGVQAIPIDLAHLSIYIYPDPHSLLPALIFSSNNTIHIHSCQKSIYPCDSTSQKHLLSTLHTLSYTLPHTPTYSTAPSTRHLLLGITPVPVVPRSREDTQTHRNNVSLPRFQSQPVQYQVHSERSQPDPHQPCLSYQRQLYWR